MVSFALGSKLTESQSLLIFNPGSWPQDQVNRNGDRKESLSSTLTPSRLLRSPPNLALLASLEVRELEDLRENGNMRWCVLAMPFCSSALCLKNNKKIFENPSSK